MEMEYRHVLFRLTAAMGGDEGCGEKSEGSVEKRGAASDGSWQFEGLAAVFHNIDDSLFGDIIAPGAFAADLPAFLADGFIGGLNHDWGAPLGRPLEASETEHGLAVKATISDTAYGRDVRTLMRDGVIRHLSIGFRALGHTWLETADEVRAYWREHGYAPAPEDLAKAQRGARLLTRIRLYEISPVAVPANPRTAIGTVRSRSPYELAAPLPWADTGSLRRRAEGAYESGTRFEDRCALFMGACEELLEQATRATGGACAEAPRERQETLRGLRACLRGAAYRLDDLLQEEQRASEATQGSRDDEADPRRAARRLFAAYQHARARTYGVRETIE